MRKSVSVLCAALLLLAVHGSAVANGDATARVATRLGQQSGVDKVKEVAGKVIKVGAALGIAAVIACTSGCEQADVLNQINKNLNQLDDSNIKIGMSYHGPNFNASVNGARLAIAQLNSAGGVHGNTLELLPRNNQGDASYNLGLTESLITEYEVDALIGAEYSTVTIPMSRVAQSHGIPMVSTGATNPAVTDAGDYIFMAAFTDNVQGEVMAGVAYNDLDARTAAVLTQQGDVYSEGLSKIFIDNFTELGGTVLVITTYKRGTDNVDSQLNEVKKASPDVIFIPGFNPEVPLIANTGDRLGVGGTYIGADGWDSPGLLNAGEALEGALFSSHFSVKVPDSQLSDAARDFINSYTNDYGIPPDGFAAMAYDAVRIMAQAMKRTTSHRGEEIKSQLAATSNYEGAVFFSGYDENRHAQKSVVINIISDGEIGFHSLVNK